MKELEIQSKQLELQMLKLRLQSLESKESNGPTQSLSPKKQKVAEGVRAFHDNQGSTGPKEEEDTSPILQDPSQEVKGIQTPVSSTLDLHPQEDKNGAYQAQRTSQVQSLVHKSSDQMPWLKNIVVYNGPQSGIYTDFAIANSMVQGKKGIIYKSFLTYESAKKCYSDYQEIHSSNLNKTPLITPAMLTQPKISFANTLQQKNKKTSFQNLGRIPQSKAENSFKLKIDLNSFQRMFFKARVQADEILTEKFFTSLRSILLWTS
ncbi:hypothetical protein L6164_002146 [Bauhinia variegata]|uniref:Uncharacterized protein n=1 Tax=Bauhinia variegata TaxID=167791 RepID=A0ACB9PXG3_BAUVA|nr:hypothetical protein L6164_002146 [Bauhinia variegata]